MTNLDKVSSAVSEWIFKVAASIFPKYQIPAGSSIGNIMQGFFGINPASYNVWNELGFLAEPIIEVMVSPLVRQYLGSLPDDQIKSIAFKFVDSMVAEANRKGSINLFGMQLGADAFNGLRNIMVAKLGEYEGE